MFILSHLEAVASGGSPWSEPEIYVVEGHQNPHGAGFNIKVERLGQARFDDSPKTGYWFMYYQPGCFDRDRLFGLAVERVRRRRFGELGKSYEAPPKRRWWRLS